jgi:ribosomal protein S18 acetylase RimI-like enzyme
MLDDVGVVVGSDGPVVRLRPMTAMEFETWRDIAIRGHAEQTCRATGRSLEDALENSAQLLPSLLCDGPDTEGMNLFVVVDDGSDEPVGWLWVGSSSSDDPDPGYVWDVIIAESRRGRGYGRAAMIAAEQFVAQQGKARISLQVAAWNDVARHLYESMGYRVVMTTMSKVLPPSDAESE